MISHISFIGSSYEMCDINDRMSLTPVVVMGTAFHIALTSGVEGSVRQKG